MLKQIKKSRVLLALGIIIILGSLSGCGNKGRLEEASKVMDGKEEVVKVNKSHKQTKEVDQSQSGYYYSDINSKEEYSELLEKLKSGMDIETLSLNINCVLDTFVPTDFQFLSSLHDIDINTLCSLAEKMNYLPWVQQNDYDIQIVWNKDITYSDQEGKPPFPAYFKDFPYYKELNFGAEDYLEVYNKKVEGNKSYQVYTFLDKKYDYHNNDLGKISLIIEDLSKVGLSEKEYQIIDVTTPEYIDKSFGEWNTHKMQFGDLNFDGYEDMYMDIMQSGNKSYKCYYAFLWEEEKQQYIEDESFTCFWYNFDSFVIDKENKRIVYGKKMTASDYYYGIIKYLKGEFIETESLELTNNQNNNYIKDYVGYVINYTYKVQGKTKMTLYKKEGEELTEEEINNNFPEFRFVRGFNQK